ncbi:MAG: hypothetical protein ACOCVZ_04525 [Gemmatimonadota bacterium]
MMDGTPPLREESVLERLLIDLHAFHPRGARGPQDVVRAWLRSSEPGAGLRRYLADEASLLDAAANRLNIAGDDDLRRMARELGHAADRLRNLAGVPEDGG